MSSKIQSSADSDIAYTRDEVANAICRKVPTPAPGALVYEPCAGNGAFLRAFDEMRWKHFSTELDPDAPAVVAGRSVLANALHVRREWVAARNPEVWTNPPFALSDNLMQKWMDVGIKRAVLLLRVGWITARKRKKWQFFLAGMYLLTPRPGFIRPGKPDGTDSAEYAVFDFQFYGSLPAQRAFDFIDWSI